MFKSEELLKVVLAAMSDFNNTLPTLTKVQWNAWLQENDIENLNIKAFPVDEKLKSFYPFTLDNVVIEFCDEQSAKQKYLELCEKHFPAKLTKIESNDFVKRDFGAFGAEAFIGRDKSGILIRDDLPYSQNEYYIMILHELAHIYCVRTEMVQEEHFIDIYLGTTTDEMAEGDRVLDGVITSGYEIWREFIADYVAMIVANPPSYYLNEKTTILKTLVDEFKTTQDAVVEKRIISDFLFEVISSIEVLRLINNKDIEDIEQVWGYIRAKIEKMDLFAIKTDSADFRGNYLSVSFKDAFYKILCIVFEHIVACPKTKFEWNIDKEFIIDLGSVYIELKVSKF